MRRITTWLLSTVSALVLLFSYHTSTELRRGHEHRRVGHRHRHGLDVRGRPADRLGVERHAGSGTPSDSGSLERQRLVVAATAAPRRRPAKTYSGDAVSTRFGDVQVEITVDRTARITDSRSLQVPWNDHKDQEINSYAVPILNSEAVDAQSADIDMVSGATYTSQGYIESLQSAIDQANL